MTPIQAINALFHSCGTSMADLEVLDDLIRAGVNPAKLDWVDTPMPEAQEIKIMQAHNTLVKAGAKGVAMRKELLAAFLTDMLSGNRQLAESLLQRFLRASN